MAVNTITCGPPPLQQQRLGLRNLITAKPVGNAATDADERRTRLQVRVCRLARRETIERLMEHVKAMPKNQQEAVRLRFHGDHSYQEISKITELSQRNVGFILDAAMRHLREKMDRDEKDEKIIYMAKRMA